jgi:hypothetical protein
MQKVLVILQSLLKPHNIGTHSKGIETSFQVVPLNFTENTFSLVKVFKMPLGAIEAQNWTKLVKMTTNC